MSGEFSPEEPRNLWTQMELVIRLSPAPKYASQTRAEPGPQKPAGRNLGVEAHHAGAELVGRGQAEEQGSCGTDRISHPSGSSETPASCPGWK